MTPAEEAVLAAARAYRDAHARCLAVGLDPPDGIDMDAAGDTLLTAATFLVDAPPAEAPTVAAVRPWPDPAPEPSVSDAVLDSIRDVLGLRPGQDILAAVRLTKARAVENERLLTQREEAVADAERHRRDAQHHGRLCGRLLDEIEALGYYTDRLLDPTLYAEAMKAAGREVKS